MIGWLSLPPEDAPQDHLARLAADLAARGWRVAGAVQRDSGPDRRDCDMDLAVLDGPSFRISQSLGPGASACRLDAGALAAAVRAVEDRLAAGADLLILPKFGRQEAAGRGFVPVIAAALEAGVPVVLNVAPDLRAAFAAFAGDWAAALTPATLEGWVRAARVPA